MSNNAFSLFTQTSSPPAHPSDQAQGSSSTWLITFTDLMALMLTFFVLSFSISDPDPQAWAKLSSPIPTEIEAQDDIDNGQSDQPLQHLSDAPSAVKNDQGKTISLPRINFQKALNLDYLKALLNTKLQQDQSISAPSEKLSDIQILRQKDRLVLSLPGDLFFASGQSDMTHAGKNGLQAIAPILNQLQNAIQIIGHADPTPLKKNALYQSNWHLSLARAQNVAYFMHVSGYKRKLSIEGYASSRYDETSQSFSPAIRNKLSRRVDIVILNDDRTPYNDLQLKLK